MNILQSSNAKRLIHSCLWLSTILTWSWSSSSSSSLVVALHADEANITDFHVTTCGHGTVSSATYNNDIVISSGNKNSCYICGRDANDGNVLWRRNVCSTNNKDNDTTTTNVALDSNKGAYSISNGIVKHWDELGNTINEEYYNKGSDIIIDETTNEHTALVIVTTNDNKLLIVNEYLEQVHEINLIDVLSKYGKGGARLNPKNFEGTVIVKAVNNGYFVLAVIDNNSSDSNTVISSLATMKLKDDFSIDKITSFKVNIIQSELSSSSFSVTKDGVVIVGLVESSGFWLFSDSFGSKWHSVSSINTHWSAIESFNVLQGDYIEIKAILIDSAADQKSVDLFHINSSGAFKSINISPTQKSFYPTIFATSISPNNKNKIFMCSIEEDDDKYKVSINVLLSGTTTIASLYASSMDDGMLLRSLIDGKVISMTLSCTESNNNVSCHVLLSTSIGTTIQLSPLFTHEALGRSSLNIDWKQEESLGFISNALFMDYNANDHSQHNHDNNDQESSSTLVAPSNNNKLLYYGFHKLLLLLSNTYDILFAMDTVGANKGNVIYKLPLDSNANKHVLVHGNPTSKSSVHGAYFTTNTQHVTSLLILSIYSNKVQFKCLHTPSGKLTLNGEQLFHQDKVITNIYPIYDENNEYCKQSALLLFDDDTIQIIPSDTTSSSSDDHSTASSILSKSSNSKDGMYFHTVDKDTGNIQCQKLHTQDDFKLEVTGQTTINPHLEIIKNVHYPLRNEVVQTPTTILGDDSLLIKYLNPHIMVIVSELTSDYLSKVENEEENNDNDFFTAVMSNTMSRSDGTSSTSTKKKPLGVTPTNSTSTSSNTQSSSYTNNIPSLFVTLVDTTSCRILHRASHSHTTSKNINNNKSSITPLTISENWIVYSYFNHKSKRTELSVLTLYEGMIDKHGITAFNTPDQELEFDSFTFPKPIVLQKTYAVSKQITSIGVTTTSRGITSKNFIFSLGDVGWIWKVDSRMLDPRRPTAELKAIEKMEGLIRYSPLLPIMSSHIISYNLRIENPTNIISTSARLESQSLILAYGGPDLFFTRLAPSKGFDLLPDEFNKSLVGILTVGLLGILLYAKKMSERKILKAAWA